LNKPKASAILLLEKGKLYGDQKERAENEPKAEVIIEPTCPHYFRPSEREAWEYLAEILRNYTIYLDINAPLLEMAAVYLAEFRNSQWEIIRSGKRVRGSRDRNKRNPAVGDRNKSAELLIKILNELNISASGIARIGSLIVKKQKETEMESLLD